MRDEDKTRAQLIDDLRELRRRIAAQEAAAGSPGTSHRQALRRQVGRRLRDAIARMQRSDEIHHVLTVLKDGLKELEVPFLDCGINLIDSERDPTVVSLNSLGGAGEWKEPDQAWGEDLVYGFWRAGVPVYRRDLEAEDIYGEREGYPKYFGHAVRCVLDVPFAYGTLAVNSSEPEAFSAEDIEDLTDLAVVLEEGFRRREDLRNLERRNRELEAEITERKLAEEQAARFGRVLENSLNEVYIFDAQTLHFIHVNRGARRNLGYSMQELCRLGPWDLKPEFTAQAFADLIEPLRTGAQELLSFTTLHQRKDGSRYPVDVYLQFIRDGSPFFVSIILDITERKRAEEERERLFIAIEQVAESIVITDAEGSIQYVNPAFERITGYTRAEAMGQNPRLQQSGEHDAGFYRAMWVTLRRGERWSGRLINKKKDGTLFTEEAVISPVFDASGRVINFVAVKRDITEHLKLEQQLLQAQKMESIGRLAGGVAHDFNNMLGVILGNTELALEQVDPGQPVHLSLVEIRTAAEHSAELTRQLLAFARQQTIAPRVLDLNDTIEGMLKMLQRLIGEDIDLAWLPAMGLWPVKVDPSQIDQILANLCINTRDAIEGVGKVTIETGNTTFDAAYCAEHPGFICGEFVLLAVSDTGRGMDQETLDRLYEPFFTTKEQGKGTGLGLATVYGIVKQNSGFINVYSEPDAGTTFKIYLPRHVGEIDATVVTGTEGPVRGGHETILLVEDEPSILKATAMMLGILGYTVLTASTPGEAIRLAQAHTGRIDLLLTDVVMPEMNGGELAKALRSFCPGIRQLFMSGYTPNVIAHRGVLDEGVNFIQKPFRRQGLAVKVREILDRPQG